MFERLRQLLAPPVFEGDEEKTRAANLLNVILLATFLLAALLTLVTALIGATDQRSLLTGAVTAILSLSMWLLMCAGFVRPASLLFSTMMLAAVTASLYFGGTIRAPIASVYVVCIVTAGLLIGQRAAGVFAALSLLALFVLLQAEMAGLLPPVADEFVGITQWVVYAASFGIITVLLNLATRSITEALGQARTYATELEDQQEYLEETVQERTRDLSRRARYLEASALVGRQTASVLDLQELLSRVVDLISEQFEFYHTGLFLLDELGEWAVLQAASSEGGQQMLARGHRLRVGQEGIVGYVTVRGVSRILLDVGEDAIYFDNPDLPDTRSEVALPLQTRGEIIGALDVQSREPAAFSQEDVAVLQTLADQVAVAISNAQLFQQVQESYDAERRAYGLVSRDAWAEMLRTRPKLGYSYRKQVVIPVGEAAEELERPDEELSGLKLPVEHRGQRLGTLVAHKAADAGDWASEEIEMVETLVTQVSVALEGARLYQDTQRRAAQEQLVGEITARMRETLDMDAVLQTAVQEMRQALALHDVTIRLSGADGPPESKNKEGRRS